MTHEDELLEDLGIDPADLVLYRRGLEQTRLGHYFIPDEFGCYNDEQVVFIRHVFVALRAAKLALAEAYSTEPLQSAHASLPAHSS